MGKTAHQVEAGRRRLHPDHVAVRRVGQSPRDARLRITEHPNSVDWIGWKAGSVTHCARDDDAMQI